MKRVSLPVLSLVLLLLLSAAFAHELNENKNGNVKYEVDQWRRPGFGGRGPGWGGPGFGGRGPGWGGRGPGWGPRGCRFRCRFGRCCSAEEYAEFVKAHGVPHN